MAVCSGLILAVAVLPSLDAMAASRASGTTVPAPGPRIALYGDSLVSEAGPEFAALEPAETTAAVRGRLLIDACQAVDPTRWRAAGWTVAAPFPASPPKGAAVASSTLL